MKEFETIKKPLTSEKAKEVYRALLEADKPFVKELTKLYAVAPCAFKVRSDMTIELVDLYLNLPPELKEVADKIEEARRQTQEIVLRHYGIDPAKINQKKR